MPLKRPDRIKLRTPDFEYVDEVLHELYVNPTFLHAYSQTGHKVYWDEIIKVLQVQSRVPVTADNKAKGKVPPKKDDLLNTISLWRLYDRQEKEDAIINKLSFTAKNDALKLWLQAVTGEVNHLTYAVLEHWLWQVKRKLHYKQPQPHIFPVFVGGEGVGKSIALRRLLSPLEHLCDAGADFSLFSDPNQWSALKDTAVFFMDEMARADSADNKAMKNIITAESKSYRLFYTQEMNRVDQLASFIGAANEDVSTLIRDNTRRFFQINVPHDTDRKVINSIDYVSLWQGIDEAAEISPAADLWAEVRRHQEEHVKYISPVEEWLQEQEIGIGQTTTMAAFEHYKAFEAAREPYSRLSEYKFRTALTRFGVVRDRNKELGRFYKMTLTPTTSARMNKVDGSNPNTPWKPRDTK